MINKFFTLNMTRNILTKLIENAEKAEKRLLDLKIKLEEVRKIKIDEKITNLTTENKTLAADIERVKAELIILESLNGKKQYSVPSTDNANGKLLKNNNLPTECETPIPTKKVKKDKETVAKSKDKTTATIPANDSPIDIRKLDFRIGKIIEVNKHADADSLYVEKIDCGEEKPRTVVSGLVNHVPIEEMRNRIVMILCNLKPVKMRGVTSEAMVMCASSPEKVEVLIPPPSAVPGDLVTCEGYPREPEAILNPKKKIFETCAPDLKTDENKIACYKGSPLVVAGKGAVVAQTLKGVHVK